MTTRWGLFVEQNVGSRERRYWEVSLLGEVDGTREEALTALWRKVQVYRPAHPAFVRRERVYRQPDGGFLALYEGATSDFGCRFSVGELVRDTAIEEKGRRQAVSGRAGD
jgi:hypothetical protein